MVKLCCSFSGQRFCLYLCKSGTLSYVIAAVCMRSNQTAFSENRSLSNVTVLNSSTYEPKVEFNHLRVLDNIKLCLDDSSTEIKDHIPHPILKVGVTEGYVLSFANTPCKQRGFLLLQVRMETEVELSRYCQSFTADYL